MLSVSTTITFLAHREPLTHRIAERSKQNEIFVRNHATVSSYDMSFFVESFSAKTERNLVCLSSLTTVWQEHEAHERSMVNFKHLLTIHMFLSLFVVRKALLQFLVQMSLSKRNILCQKPQMLMSNLASGCWCAEWWRVSPVIGSRFGSISTSCYRSPAMWLISSFKSSCLLCINPPFWHDIAWLRV